MENNSKCPFIYNIELDDNAIRAANSVSQNARNNVNHQSLESLHDHQNDTHLRGDSLLEDTLMPKDGGQLNHEDMDGANYADGDGDDV